MLESVISVVNEIKASVANPKPDTFCLTSVNLVGNWGRQGDIMIKIIKKPTKKEIAAMIVIPKFDGQLAQGTTRGSRHCVNPEDVVAYLNPENTKIEKGPILFIDVKDKSKFVNPKTGKRVKAMTIIDHPDHGSVKLEDGLWLEVTYQVNFNQKSRERVKD